MGDGEERGGVKKEGVTAEHTAEPVDQRVIAAIRKDHAGEGGEGIRTTDGAIPSTRWRSLSTVVGRLNAWIIQETQQVAPVMVPTEFVLQPPVVRIRHGTVAEMIGRLSSQPLGLGGKVRRLSSVICLPELHRFSEQAAQTIAEAATSPSLGLDHLTDQHVGQTFLLLYPRQSLSIVAPSSVRYHHPFIVQGVPLRCGDEHEPGTRASSVSNAIAGPPSTRHPVSSVWTSGLARTEPRSLW